MTIPPGIDPRLLMALRDYYVTRVELYKDIVRELEDEFTLELARAAKENAQ